MFHVLVYHSSIFHNCFFFGRNTCAESSFSVFTWLVTLWLLSFYVLLLLFIKTGEWEKAILKIKFILTIIYLICINLTLVRFSFEKVFPKYSSSMGLLYICRIQLLLPTSKYIHMHCTIPGNSQIIAFEILSVKMFSLTLYFSISSSRY